MVHFICLVFSFLLVSYSVCEESVLVGMLARVGRGKTVDGGGEGNYHLLVVVARILRK